MSKRLQTTSAETNPKNFWPTPQRAVAPLAEYLPGPVRYQEPCAGDGSIITHMAKYGHICTAAVDIEPRSPMVMIGRGEDLANDHEVITNPPFAWDMLKPLLDAWIGTVPCWLLLPWDMPCNVRMGPYAAHIGQIIPIGRISWLGNGQGGYENYGWFHFSIYRQNFILPRNTRTTKC